MSNIDKTSATLEYKISYRAMFQTCLVGAASCELTAIFGAAYGVPAYVGVILIGGTALSVKYVVRYHRGLKN